jgi:hypothetical protein
MLDSSIRVSLTEKKCPLCNRGLARNHGPEIPCTLCVRLGPPSVRFKRTENETCRNRCGRKDQAVNTPVEGELQIKGGFNEEE